MSSTPKFPDEVAALILAHPEMTHADLHRLLYERGYRISEKQIGRWRKNRGFIVGHKNAYAPAEDAIILSGIGEPSARTVARLAQAGFSRSGSAVRQRRILLVQKRSEKLTRPPATQPTGARDARGWLWMSLTGWEQRGDPSHRSLA